MNMTHDIVPISPLTKETLKRYKNDKEVQGRMNRNKGYVQKIYGETIKSAINGNTNYTCALSSLHHYQLYLHDKQYILELITELYLVFPDSTIQYTEKNICGIEDSKIIEPCIVIDWS